MNRHLTITVLFFLVSLNRALGQSTIVGEVGIINDADCNAKTREYNDNWCNTDPVVIAKPLSYNDTNPAVVRVWDVERIRFKYRVQNFSYGTLNDDHGVEDLGFMVMEKGTHVLQNGAWGEAGTIAIGRTTGVTDPFVTVTFSDNFTSALRIASTPATPFQDPPERHSKWVTGLALGFVGGALLGGAIGYALDEDGNDTSPALAAAVGASVGTLVSAPLGAIIGASIRAEQSAESGSLRVQFRMALSW